MSRLREIVLQHLDDAGMTEEEFASRVEAAGYYKDESVVGVLAGMDYPYSLFFIQTSKILDL